MARQGKKSRWSVGQRLEFIDFRLFWEGHVNRGDLVSFFGVSVPQASSDLAEYQKAAKGNAVYDKTRKTYVAGRRFKPVFFEPSADEYLAQLRLIQAGLLTDDEAWAVRLPSYSIVPILRRRLEPATLRRILDAIRTRSSIHINYQSKSSPKPKWRWIAPHALGFDGFRWHARAWCHTHQEFRDFVLARILETGEAGLDEIDPAADAGWQREVTLKLAPHPGLKGGDRRAVDLDFGMTDGEIEVSMKVCMAYYFMLQLGLDDDQPVAEPDSHQLVLVNRAEVEAAKKEAGRC
ncbi:MAG: WYL domain-containing protein [Isosphaeraceae bacterium]|nr:WYL domain-containing protein [Isosphaeraceae bacterium]